MNFLSRFFLTIQRRRGCIASGLAAMFLAIPAVAQTAGETVLHAFTGADGENIATGLVLGPKGVCAEGVPYCRIIYGTAPDGGGTNCVDYWSGGQTTGCGVVFELIPPVAPGDPWTEQTIYTFTGGADGAFPGTLLYGGKGVLYGTAKAGGPGASGGSGLGTLYELEEPKGGGSTWTEKVLYSFCRRENCDDGANPGDGLLASGGALYGTTAYGGKDSEGTVFKYTLRTSTSAPEFQTLYAFQGLDDGAIPFSGVIADTSGILYGLTYSGGGTGCGGSGCGTAYELSPVGSGATYEESVIYRFQGEPDTAQPGGRMTLLSPGHLVGVGGIGGDTNYGTIFELISPGTVGALWTEMILTDFGIPNLDPPDSSFPNGNLALASDGSFWGTSYGGGATDIYNGNVYYAGTIFQLQPPSQGSGQWSRNIRYSFAGPGGLGPAGFGTDGFLPGWGLINGPDGSFIGTTTEGGGYGCPVQGSLGCGTVFQFVPF
jgi:uncharacterized repeat protein (TIGR03803 family)